MSTESQSKPTRNAEGATDPAESTSIPKDDAFHLLQNTRRRAALRYMIQEDATRFVMRDIAEALAAWEHDTTVDQLRSNERQRVYISLYQSHLPKLASHGIIEYDQDRGTVEPRPRLKLLEPYLGDGLETSDQIAAPDVTETAEPRGLLDFFSS